jgi:DNA-directed RNA polymerase subunit RPC12/RpoP
VSAREVAELEARIDALLRKTPDGSSYLCRYCGKTGGTRQNIRNHIETHVATAGFICTICGKHYRTRNSLNVHRSGQHREEPIFY